MSMTPLDQELLRCKADFWYWARRYGTVMEKPKGREGSTEAVMTRGVVKFVPYEYQKQAVAKLMADRWMYWLKSRQQGATTVMNLFFLWTVLFWPNSVHAIVAHREDTVTELFDMFFGMYARLDVVMKEVFPILKKNDGRMEFKNGSKVIVAAAGSPKLSGLTLTSLHLSEFGKYENPDKTLSDIRPALAPGCMMVFETTADEGKLRQKEYWDEDNGIGKFFVPWTASPEYVDRQSPGQTVDDKVEKYARQWKLTDPQKAFVYKNTRMGWGDFHRNYPISPELAFTVAGERFFTRRFDAVPWRTGLMTFAQPEMYGKYTLGADGSSGTEKGDFASLTVLKWRDDGTLEGLCETFYERVKPLEFGEVTLEMARKWQAVVNPETNNGWGLTVIERLIMAQYGRIYRSKSIDSATGAVTDRLGWHTSERSRANLLMMMQKAIDSQGIDGRYLLPIPCPRLQSEINSFEAVSVRTVNGWRTRWEAKSGGHDDALFSFALAVAAGDQLVSTQQQVLTRRPQTPREMLAFYQANCRPADETDVFDDDSVKAGGALQPLSPLSMM